MDSHTDQSGMFGDCRLNDTNIRAGTCGREQVNPGSISYFVGAQLEGKDPPAVAHEARGKQCIEPGLRADVVDRHAGLRQTLERSLFVKFVGTEPASMDGASGNPFHSTLRAAPYTHHRTRRQRTRRQTQNSASQRAVVDFGPVNHF